MECGFFKFSVGNYEALSSASHREDCDRSSTDYKCQVRVEPLRDSSQIFPRAEKRAACSTTKNKCLLAGDEFRNPNTDGFNDNRDDSRGNDISKYSKASIRHYLWPTNLSLT